MEHFPAEVVWSVAHTYVSAQGSYEQVAQSSLEQVEHIIKR